MKNCSIRLKITLWFALILVVIVALTVVVILSVSNSVLQKTIRDNLIETIEHNVDEIEFFTKSEMEHMEIDNDADHYIVYRNGYLEIDDDFLDEVNQVFSALHLETGDMLYGENPIGRMTAEYEFSDGQVQKVTVDGVTYYLFDRALTEDGLDGLWLRGVVSEQQGSVQMSNIVRVSLGLLPLLLVLALLGGYIIAGRSLKPIRVIEDAATQISKGQDLKKRIEIGDGKDELHNLAQTFNDMFQRLEESFESEQQFTSDVSHELRTPMSVILAQCEYTMEKERSPVEYEAALEIIQRQGGKMNRLIEEMLRFVRLEQKADSFPVEQVDLSQLTQSISEDMALLKEQGITLTAEIEEGIQVSGNRNLLSRLLVNLISNAYRYGKENGSIHVSLTTQAGDAVLSVRDDGIGIAEDRQQKIFDRFYQVDSSRSGAGTGLGLSMVREIVRFHGGEIHVESEPGRGSNFIFVLKKV